MIINAIFLLFSTILLILTQFCLVYFRMILILLPPVAFVAVNFFWAISLIILWNFFTFFPRRAALWKKFRRVSSIILHIMSVRALPSIMVISIRTPHSFVFINIELLSPIIFFNQFYFYFRLVMCKATVHAKFAILKVDRVFFTKFWFISDKMIQLFYLIMWIGTHITFRALLIVIAKVKGIVKQFQRSSFVLTTVPILAMLQVMIITDVALLSFEVLLVETIENFLLNINLRLLLSKELV